MVSVVALVEKTLHFAVKNTSFPAASFLVALGKFYINGLFTFYFELLTISLNGKLGISIGQYA